MVVLWDLGVLLNCCSDGCSTFCAVTYQENREKQIWQSCLVPLHEGSLLRVLDIFSCKELRPREAFFSAHE